MFKKYIALSALLALCTSFTSFTASAQSADNDIVFGVNCSAEDVYDCEILESDRADKVMFPNGVSEGDTFSLRLFVKNMSGINIVTVRSWLQYDTSVFEAIDLSEDDSDFPLAAPDGNEVDSESGIVKIGRGVTGGGADDELLLIATVEFQVIANQAKTAQISFVNFQKDTLGETGVFVLNQDTFQPENILDQPPKALEIAINGGYTTPPSNPNDNIPLPPTTIPPVETPETNNQLPRPEGLRVKANISSTNLVWKLSSDERVKGYYVYYSQTSGRYIHRRDVGKTNHSEFTDLQKNKTYYFAVTAYDENGRESDYSDEVYATHGVPGSESHPFVIKDSTPEQPTTPQIVSPPENLDESGPAETFAISFGILGMFFLLFSFFRLRLFSFFV